MTPIAWWACAKIHHRLALPPFPLCLPSTPTHMQASTWHRHHQICPAGWTVPIVLLLHCHCCTLLLTRCAIVVILIVINIFFSSFSDADPSHIMLVDCWMLCCRECGPIMAVWQRWPPWLIYLIAFYPILPSFLSRHTWHNSAKPKSNHKPTTYPTKYLRQYSTDEDVLNLLRINGGQTPVLYGGTYSLSWGWRFMVNGEKTKKTNILHYLNQ